ncbi:MAG: hypothetical protein ACK5LP_00220 [Campylobacteraceae bacterium]
MKKDLTLKETIDKSMQIRELYQSFEKKKLGTIWSVEEDMLAFLSDAGVVARLTMAHEKRWLHEDFENELKYKVSECFWWLMVISKRMDIDLEKSFLEFIDERNSTLK